MTFTEDQIRIVWDRARIIDGTDKNLFRQDACGAWIRWDKYGDRDSQYGWEVDHIYPLSLGGDDSDCNLRALHCQNNISKGNDYPSYLSVLTSSGINNVTSERYLTVNEKKREQLRQIYPNA